MVGWSTKVLQLFGWVFGTESLVQWGDMDEHVKSLKIVRLVGTVTSSGASRFQTNSYGWPASCLWRVWTGLFHAGSLALGEFWWETNLPHPILRWQDDTLALGCLDLWESYSRRLSPDQGFFFIYFFVLFFMFFFPVSYNSPIMWNYHFHFFSFSNYVKMSFSFVYRVSLMCT